MIDTDGMARFWDRRARDDPYYYIYNNLSYGSPDAERFWASGEVDLEALLGALGVELQPTDEVVEVGCGIGRMTRVIAARAASVAALDVSEQMLALAAEHNPELAAKVSWLQGNGSSLEPIADRSADTCISHVVLQHIPDPEIALGYVVEMGRVLRAGGWAAFQVSNDPSVHRPPPTGPLRRVARTAVTALRRRPRGQAHPAWLGSAVTISQLQTAAAEGGLEIERIVGAGTQFCLVHAVKLPH